MKRDEKIQKHLRKIEKIDEEMERLIQSTKDARLDSEQQAILAQKQMDLAATKERANKIKGTCQEDPLGIYNNSNPKPRIQPLKKNPQTSQRPATSTQDQHSGRRDQIRAVVEHNESPSKTEWQRQKDQENAHNPAIDKIMEMIGLEEVKAQVLRIKAKVDTSIRQGTDLKKERLGLVLLGNPGTGFSPI